MFLVRPALGQGPPRGVSRAGRGGATEGMRFAACGEARDPKSATTKGVLQLLQ